MGKILQKFDPWNSKLCTCPPKLSLNPYTGCENFCLYCYASSYIPNFFQCRPKKDFLKKLKKEAKNLKGELISLSNSSDPYPEIERKLCLTRNSLKILAQANCRLQIITKSTLVLRDIDILKKMKVQVSLTVTTISDRLCRKLEKRAPLSSQRIKAIKTLIENEIPVTVRIDPIIPYLNEDQAKLIKILAQIGVKHITSSTYKVKPDNWQRFKKAFPKIAQKLFPLYFEKGEKIGQNYYLPKNLRLKILKKIQDLAKFYKLKVGFCREGLNLNSDLCDGSWVI